MKPPKRSHLVSNIDCMCLSGTHKLLIFVACCSFVLLIIPFSFKVGAGEGEVQAVPCACSETDYAVVLFEACLLCRLILQSKPEILVLI